MTETTAPPTTSQRSVRQRATDSFATNLLGIGLVVLIAWFSISVPTFFAASTLADVLNQSAILAVVVFPFALLLITGYVDLSVGSNLALSATIGALVMGDTQSVWLGLLACIGTGTAVGVVNGVLTVRFGFSPIIVTLATLTAGRGFAQTIYDNNGQMFGAMPTSVTSFGNSDFLGIPRIAFVAIIVFAVCGVLLRHSPTGRHLYAIGVSPRAAYLSGVQHRRIVTLLYIAVGLITGIASMLYISRYVSVQPATLGQGFEIEVLTAVLLGGVAFNGGQGTIVGAALGVLVIGVLSAGLQQMAVLPDTQLLIKGIVLGFAAALQWWRARLSGARSA